MAIPRWLASLPMLVAVAAAGCSHGASAQPLATYNVKLEETSVSGISSGAYMAVQFAVANSSIVKGVGATAGGPYFCAEAVYSTEYVSTKVLGRCMQGDPWIPTIPITSAYLAELYRKTEAFAARGLIDPTSNLARQKVWIFHGYNDGLVKKAVSDALFAFYSHYAGSQVFYKDNLAAGHAQIIDHCPSGGRDASPLTNCDCRRTGDEFIKNCGYDAAGSLLRHIHGELNQRAATPGGELKTFDQDEFARDLQGRQDASSISMGKTGYLYVPASCSAMNPCRVHIAFHGCLQYADNIGDRFARYAGYNEWADTNSIIVLYPQTASNLSVINPLGCWDWWGYNQRSDKEGKYATKAGPQVATIRRMLERIAGAGANWRLPRENASLAVTDTTDHQVALRWSHVDTAAAYNVYRADSTAGPYVRTNPNGPILGDVFVDTSVAAGKAYSYVLKGIDRSGKEMAESSAVRAATPRPPPRCDPYFSLVMGRAVTRFGLPTSQVCP